MGRTADAGDAAHRGIPVAQSTVEPYRGRARTPPSPPGKTFLANHGQDLGAFDCFPVITGTFRLLCVLVLLAHARWRVGHCNVTEHPPTPWTAQQGVGALPWDGVPRYRLRERLSGAALRQWVTYLGSKEGRRTPRSPWQHP
jgi:hypothetical protein